MKIRNMACLNKTQIQNVINGSLLFFEWMNEGYTNFVHPSLVPIQEPFGPLYDAVDTKQWTQWKLGDR